MSKNKKGKIVMFFPGTISVEEYVVRYAKFKGNDRLFRVQEYDDKELEEMKKHSVHAFDAWSDDVFVDFNALKDSDYMIYNVRNRGMLCEIRISEDIISDNNRSKYGYYGVLVSPNDVPKKKIVDFLKGHNKFIINLYESLSDAEKLQVLLGGENNG